MTVSCKRLLHLLRVMWKKKIFKENLRLSKNTCRTIAPCGICWGSVGCRIKPEDLPPAEDIKKLRQRVRLQEKKLAAQS